MHHCNKFVPVLVYAMLSFSSVVSNLRIRLQIKLVRRQVTDLIGATLIKSQGLVLVI